MARPVSASATFTALMLATASVPALAQDHAGHTMPEVTAQEPAQKPMPQPAQDDAQAAARDACEKVAASHRAMGHAVPADACAPEGDDAAEGDAMAAMDHASMDHGTAAGDIPVLPPPAAAGAGPPRAADAIWGADAMRSSRDALARENGGMLTTGLMLDRFEYRARSGEDGFLWDGKAWFGGDLERAWLESEGEGSFADGLEDADVSLLYGRAITPWFDLQAGIRQDLTGPKRTYLDLGIQGLAPYLFEVEADVYLSNSGDLTASAEVELDQRITQRLIIQPRAELSLSAQDVPELGIGAGFNTLETGLRLRYEIAREFAPYIGIEQEWKIGRSADYARAMGEDPSTTNFVAGVRFWF